MIIITLFFSHSFVLIHKDIYILLSSTSIFNSPINILTSLYLKATFNLIKKLIWCYWFIYLKCTYLRKKNGLESWMDKLHTYKDTHIYIYIYIWIPGMTTSVYFIVYKFWSRFNFYGNYMPIMYFVFKQRRMNIYFLSFLGVKCQLYLFNIDV